jgi:hypothetical protein
MFKQWWRDHWKLGIRHSIIYLTIYTHLDLCFIVENGVPLTVYHLPQQASPSRSRQFLLHDIAEKPKIVCAI